MIRRRLVVTGRVQGVSYRAWFVREASALGLVGWVRNRRDGSVEAVVEGSADKVAVMIERARRGPLLARVDGIATSDEDGIESLLGFGQRPTA